MVFLLLKVKQKSGSLENLSYQEIIVYIIDFGI